jgi:hypothetical protein
MCATPVRPVRIAFFQERHDFLSIANIKVDTALRVMGKRYGIFERITALRLPDLPLKSAEGPQFGSPRGLGNLFFGPCEPSGIRHRILL